MSKTQRILGTVVMIATLFYILAASAVAAPELGPNQPEYWETRGEHPSTCYKHEGDSNHGNVGPSNTVTLNTFDQSWPGDHWETLVIKYATFNDVYQHPSAGVPYVTGTEQDVSHWIVCKGTTPDTTTTVPDTTTTIPDTTTTSSTTTIPDTTTSSSTTSSSTTSTVPNDTTTTTGVTSTTLEATTTTTLPVSSTTEAPTTTIPEVQTDIAELPTTGANVMVFGLIGMALLLTGGFVLALARDDQ